MHSLVYGIFVEVGVLGLAGLRWAGLRWAGLCWVGLGWVGSTSGMRSGVWDVGCGMWESVMWESGMWTFNIGVI